MPKLLISVTDFNLLTPSHGFSGNLNTDFRMIQSENVVIVLADFICLQANKC